MLLVDDLPSLPEGWSYHRLGDLVEPARGITYGIVQPGHAVATGTPIVRVNDIRRGKILRDHPLVVADDVAAAYDRTRLRGGELLLTLVGTVGESAVVPPDFAGWNTARAVAVIPVRADVGAYWVHLCLRTPPLQRVIQVLSTTTVQATLNLKEAEELPIPMPPGPIRKGIEQTLRHLDDAIDLNLEMNNTLRATAGALFNSWFVDFDPVVANAAGHAPFGLRPSLVGLFPSRFEDSSLGPVPEGWRAGRLQEGLAALESGSRPRGGVGDVSEGVPSIGAESVLGVGEFDYDKTKYVPRRFFEAMKRGGVRYGDVLLYKDGAQIGRKTYVDCGFPFEECCINEHVFILRSNDRLTQRFLFFWLDQPWVTEEIVSSNSNTAQPGLNQPAVGRLPILYPPRAVLEAFENQAAPLLNRLLHNCNETRTLESLRDSLLLRLLAGDVRVLQPEKLVEQVM